MAAFLVAVCSVFFFSFPAWAAEDGIEKEVVFLLDTSNSMNSLETNLATQSIRLMAHTLTSDFKAGFVSFNTEVQGVCGLARSLSAFDQTVASTVFTGYSNTGAGLERAISLFSDDGGVSRSIVLLSDGEIIMAADSATQSSEAQFQSAVDDAASRGIVIHTIMLGDAGAGANVLDASAETGGTVHLAADRAQMLEAAEEILFTDFGIRQSAVAAGGAQNGRLNITLPDTGMRRAKILLTSDFTLNNVTAAGNAGDVQVTTGQRFAVVDLTAPTQTGVSVAFDAVASGDIRARLISEYDVILSAQVTYPESGVPSSESRQPPRITVTAKASNGVELWKSAVFDTKTLPLIVNGDTFSATIENGRAELEYTGAETADYSVSVDLSGFEGNFLAVEDARVREARPVVAEPEPGIDYRPLIVILVCLAAALAAVLIMGRRSAARRKPVKFTGVPPESAKPVKQFCGKLNIYVTQAPDDQDVPPQSFNLYRENRDKIRLRYIFAVCGIALGDVDDRDILLEPGSDGGLCITNQSNATVLCGRELVMKGRTAEMHYEEKVTITFDNDSEVLLHYKNVKPGERV